MAHTIVITSPSNPPKCLTRPNIAVNVTITWDANVHPFSTNSTFRVRFRLVDDNGADVVASISVGVTYSVTPTETTAFNVAADVKDVTVIATLIETTPPPLSAEIAHVEDTSGKYSMKLNC